MKPTVAEPVDETLGERARQLAKHRSLLPAILAVVTRMLVVDAYVEVRLPVDQAGKRPCITADAGGDASKIESIAAVAELDRAGSIDGDIRHQGASNGFFSGGKNGPAHGAAGAIRADYYRGLERFPVGSDRNRVAILFKITNPTVFDDLKSSLLRFASQQRVEFIAPDYSADRFCAFDQRVADDGARGCASRHGGNIEGNPKLAERQHHLRNQARPRRF